MPQPKASRKQPQPARRLPWLGVAAAVIAVGAAAYYLTNRPSESTPAPSQPAATFIPATPTATPVQFVAKHIYSETADPRADIAAALARAKREHKRVILDFGGDWCPDCQVLDIYFHQPPNEQLLDENFVLAHVWIGHEDTNLDVAAKYGVPINRGVPALAVLSPDGKVVYAQATGQFNDMRHMEAASVTEFLEKWKS